MGWETLTRRIWPQASLSILEISCCHHQHTPEAAEPVPKPVYILGGISSADPRVHRRFLPTASLVSHLSYFLSGRDGNGVESREAMETFPIPDSAV